MAIKNKPLRALIGKHLHLSTACCEALAAAAAFERRSQSSLAEELLERGLRERSRARAADAVIRSAGYQ